jgi:type II secretion system protein H
MGRRQMGGYTLLELLLVLVVMGLLTAYAFLRFGPALAHTRVRDAANVLASDFQYAQMLAVRQREPIVITFDGAGFTYTIADRGGSAYRSRAFGPTTDYHLDELTASPTTVQLYPNGIAGANATVVVGLNGYRRQVTLSRAGQVRVENAP